MTGGLILKLRPFEKILINGALLENGSRRTKIRVKTVKANILRLRDAIHPDDAKTPVKSIIYKLQLAIAGDLSPCATVAQVIHDLATLHDAMPGKECRVQIALAKKCALEGEFYHAMRPLKELIPYEETLLTRPQQKSDLLKLKAAM